MDMHSSLDAASFTKSAPPASDVAEYYSRKTGDILCKYGPGPRVHFHVGLFEEGDATNTTVASTVIQRRLVASQETLLTHCADAWMDSSLHSFELLDIGCGLGGGAIYWAQEHGSNVTALTNCPEHAPIISAFACQAGVQDRVRSMVIDFHEFSPEQKYDAAVAIESSCYMDRMRLFYIVAKALKPNGWFGIVEHFLCRSEWATFLDGYYKTHLGALTEYVKAAHAAGLHLEQNEDLTDRVREFWLQSMAWSDITLDSCGKSNEMARIDRNRLAESVVTHGKLFRIWRDHALETRMLKFCFR